VISSANPFTIFHEQLVESPDALHLKAEFYYQEGK